MSGSGGGLPEWSVGTPGGEGANPGVLPPPGAGGVMADGTESVIVENQAKYKEETDPQRSRLKTPVTP